MQNPNPLPEAPLGAKPRRRWPILAGVLGVLLIAGVVAAALVTAGPGVRSSVSPEEVALELALDDAGGADQLADGDRGMEEGAGPPAPAAGGPPPAVGIDQKGRRHHGPLPGRLGDKSLLVGSVASVADGKLTVTRDGGGELAVMTTDKTRVRGAGHKAVGDVKAGERVVVRVGSDKQAVAVLVLRPHVAGTVTALDGAKATVTRPGGTTQIVDVSAVSDKPKVGDLIAVVGTSADNGATLKAEKIKQLPKAN